jgi:hypothetical protein
MIAWFRFPARFSVDFFQSVSTMGFVNSVVPSFNSAHTRARPKPARGSRERNLTPSSDFRMGPPGFEPGTNGL